jgi:hypothetical protein
MRLLCTILLGLLLSGCYSQKRTIAFINQSEVRIDSIRIGVSSADAYTIKHVNIETSDTVIAVIPHNKPKSNNHDVMVFILIYIKNHDLIYRYNYNDLAGYLANDYTIVLNKEKEVKWVVNSTSGRY